MIQNIMMTYGTTNVNSFLDQITKTKHLMIKDVAILL